MLKASNLVEIRATVVQNGRKEKNVWSCDNERVKNEVENFIAKYGFSMFDRIGKEELYFNNGKNCDIEFSFAFVAEVI